MYLHMEPEHVVYKTASEISITSHFWDTETALKQWHHNNPKPQYINHSNRKENIYVISLLLW